MNDVKKADLQRVKKDGVYDIPLLVEEVERLQEKAILTGRIVNAALAWSESYSTEHQFVANNILQGIYPLRKRSAP